MQVDKKQVPQLIVLGVLVLCCVGYVSFKVLSPKSSSAPPEPVNKATERDFEADAQDTAMASISMDTLPAGVFPDINSVPSRRDPFAPQLMPMMECAANRLQPPVRVRKVNPLPRPTLRSGNPWAKIQPVQPIPSFSQGSGPVVVRKIEDPDPKFTLTGVVRGDQNVAIIRVGEKGRYIVKQGQLVEGRYRVLSVTSDGAVLANKDRRISLNLGGVN